MRVKRSKFVSFYVIDGKLPDFQALFLTGNAEVKQFTKIMAASALTEGEHLLSVEDFYYITNIPSTQWIDTDETNIPQEKAYKWARAGLLLADCKDEWAMRMKNKEYRLLREGWHSRSATYYFPAKWRNQKLFDEVGIDESNPYLKATQQLIEETKSIPKSHWDKLPPMFWSHPQSKRKIHLPEPQLEKYLDKSFLEVAERRYSEREFENVAIPLEALSLQLSITFRPLKIMRSAFYDALHKIPPSGGGLHPAEAFLIVSNVESLDPGLYHYSQKDHSLELIRELKQKEAKIKQVEYAAGQPYALHASAGIIMGHRFFRHHWKYYRIDRALQVLAMDIGAIAQTLYLATVLQEDLGGFFTAAVNSSDIEEELGLDGSEIGIFAVFYTGVPTANSIHRKLALSKL